MENKAVEKIVKTKVAKEAAAKKPVKKKPVVKKVSAKNSLTMKIAGEREIASDFAMKVYDKFDQMIKSIVLFGSSAKKVSTPSSDIDIIVIIDDVSIRWDEELIAWYREELRKLIVRNPYRKSLHVNTVKLSTWWDDMMRGDPVVINVLRYGDALVDFGGFFNPLRILLKQGKIRSTPESIYTLLQRAPGHMSRARQSMMAVVDGLYWTMVDSAHAALISAGVMPASPEDIGKVMMEHFVGKKMLKKKYVKHYEDIHGVAKEFAHGERVKVKGKELDEWFEMTDDFLGEMARLVDVSIEERAKR
ncbi:nucleotidyltransferase domain-containing protein [archaeon]|nr:nucleotidyltransferase domain-containing protein [archaeon]